MTDREEIIRGLQIERECVSRDCDRDCARCDLVQDREWLLSVYDGALNLLKEQDAKTGQGMDENEFMTHIITEICDYAVENDMEPDDTLSVIADNIKAILEISTFNGWKRRRSGNENQQISDFGI